MSETKISAPIPDCFGWVWGETHTGLCMYYEGEATHLKKLVLLNALVTRSDKPVILVTRPASLEDVKKLVKISDRIESYIGHEATAKLLSNMLEIEVSVNRGMYTPEEGDIAIIVRLKKRLEKPEDIKNVTEKDIEFLIVNYVTIVTQ